MTGLSPPEWGGPSAAPFAFSPPHATWPTRLSSSAGGPPVRAPLSGEQRSTGRPRPLEQSHRAQTHSVTQTLCRSTSDLCGGKQVLSCRPCAVSVVSLCRRVHCACRIRHVGSGANLAPVAPDPSRGAVRCQQQPLLLPSPTVPSCEHDRRRRGRAECANLGKSSVIATYTYRYSISIDKLLHALRACDHLPDAARCTLQH